MSEFLEIRGTVPESTEDELAELLSSWRVLGVQIEPAAAGLVTAAVWVRGDDGPLVDAIEELLRGLGAPSTELHPHPDEDWSAAWRAQLTAFEVGERWWIDPHPDLAVAPPGGRLRLAVEPRAAFGSGTHESTQAVMLQLERLDCRGRTVLDIGTGSGVLAVAADALGAARVVALDIDPVAAWEARVTAGRQSWDCRPLIVAGPLACLGDTAFDLVLCNMIVSEFDPLILDIRRLLSPVGVAVFSGILDGERRTVENMVHDRGLEVTGAIGIGGWISLRTARRETA